MAKEHEEAVALAKAAINEWKSKYNNVKNELSLKLELHRPRRRVHPQGSLDVQGGGSEGGGGKGAVGAQL